MNGQIRVVGKCLIPVIVVTMAEFRERCVKAGLSQDAAQFCGYLSEAIGSPCLVGCEILILEE